MQITERFTMFFVVAVAFLVGKHAALPNIGKCSFIESACASRKCTTSFYKGLQKDPKGDCLVKFDQVKECMQKLAKYCLGTQPGRSMKIKRECADDLTLRPFSSLEIFNCSSSVTTKAKVCMETFRRIFAADKSNSSLCSEHAKSKRCLKNLIYTECSLSPETLELTELALADHNPFCADNRDPGATGNDQCYGVKDISGPAGIDAFLSTDKPITTNAAAGIKTSVFQAFLFVFPTIWFFFSF